MRSRRKNPPPHDVLRADRATLNALKDMPAYAPHNPFHSLENLIALEARLTASELETERLRRAYEAARAREAADGWVFHDAAVGVRLEVKAQFGPDSNEVQAVGLTRASDRKRPTRRDRTASP